MVENLLELAFGNAILVECYVRGLEACKFVELNGKLSNHSSQVLADLLVLLYTHCGTVAVGVCGHATHNCRNRRFLPIPSWWVGDIGSQEDDRLLQHWRPALWQQDFVDTSQFDSEL